MKNARELFGLDRPRVVIDETRSEAPWRVFTVPNLVTLLRFLGIPIFIVLALHSGSSSVWAAGVFAIISLTDYLDGFLARALNQYSRFGTLMDPVVDRFLVASGVLMCAVNDLLPVVLIVLMLLREAFVIGWGRYLMIRDAQIPVHWYGRFGAAFAMFTPVVAFLDFYILSLTCLCLGLLLGVIASSIYVKEGIQLIKENDKQNIE